MGVIPVNSGIFVFWVIISYIFHVIRDLRILERLCLVFCIFQASIYQFKISFTTAVAWVFDNRECNKWALILVALERPSPLKGFYKFSIDTFQKIRLKK